MNKFKMEELKNNKRFKALAWIFIIISMLHVIYATITMRGLFMDGGFYMLDLLNKFSDNIHTISADWAGHPRFFILGIMQLSTIIAHSIFAIQDKWILMMIYSFAQFFLPLLALFWIYKLANRVNRPDMFFWGVFYIVDF